MPAERAAIMITKQRGTNMLIWLLHSNKITHKEKLWRAYPDNIAAAPTKAYEPGCNPGKTYCCKNSAQILPNEQPMRIPETKRPIGTEIPRVKIPNMYQIIKYISREE